MRQLLGRARTAIRDRLGAFTPLEPVVRWAVGTGNGELTAGIGSFSGACALGVKVCAVALLPAAVIGAAEHASTSHPAPASQAPAHSSSDPSASVPAPGGSSPAPGGASAAGGAAPASPGGSASSGQQPGGSASSGQQPGAPTATMVAHDQH